MRAALSHLLWTVTVLLLIRFAVYCGDCGDRGGRLTRTEHGIECLPPKR